jgi:pantothenate kinase
VQISELTFPAALTVTGQTIDISGFGPQVKAFYTRLFWETIDLYQRTRKSRAAIGIAGPTGAGKSVVAVLFQELARQAPLPFGFASVTIDAYHYPNRYLLSHLSDGAPLKQVKGRFDTYDVAALVRDLNAFAGGDNIAFPAYSRQLHEPVPDSVPITAPATLLIVEGLWLLSDQGGWEQVRPRLDFCYFIDSDPERTRAAVLKRHMAGGRTLADASRHYENVDGRNARLVLQTRPKADKVIPPWYAIT